MLRHPITAASERAELAVLGASRGSLLAWSRLVDSKFLWPKHIRYIASKLEDLETQGGKRYIIQLPPRHGKSSLVSTRFPTWFLGRDPDRRVILAAHTASLAQTFSRQSRNEFTEYAPPVFGVEVADDSSSVELWGIKGRKGGMLAVGVGGPATGAGADLMIIDDPLKDSAQAHSITYRNRIFDWYNSVARTRLHPGASVVLVMTRWHEDDLAGRLKESTGETFEDISLAAIAETEDELGRELGDALWPERYSAEALETTRKSVGSYVWSALYQQRPSPAAGMVVHRDWFRFYDQIPENANQYIISWDMAFGDAKTSSFVVGQVWCRSGADYYLVDQFRRQCDFVATCRAVASMSERFPEANGVLIEDKANGPAVLSTLRGYVPGLIPVTPRGGKEARLLSVQPLFEAGNVWFPNPDRQPWVNALIDELLAFPNASHDDQCDALSQALNRFRKDSPFMLAIDQSDAGKRLSPWVF